MEYILNKCPLKTTNGFKINDIKLNLEIPNISSFKDLEINSPIEVYTNKDGKNIKTNIGISYDKSYEVNIDVKDKVDNIYIKYDFSNSDILVSNININYLSNSRANIIIFNKSIDDNNHYNHTNINIKASKYSEGNVSIINLLNKNSYSFIDVVSNIDDNSLVVINIIDLGGKIKLSRLYSELYRESKMYLNTIYMGSDKDIIDTNYYVKNIGGKSISNIESQGVLSDTSIKNYRGIIDFISGCSHSVGKELENVVLLSDKVVSKSLPMLLCGEEDVDGAHGVSTGKIDKEKLFYLMSRGLSKKESEKLIIEANFNKVLSNIPDKGIVDEILNYIDEKV